MLQYCIALLQVTHRPSTVKYIDGLQTHLPLASATKLSEVHSQALLISILFLSQVRQLVGEVHLRQLPEHLRQVPLSMKKPGAHSVQRPFCVLQVAQFLSSQVRQTPVGSNL